MLFRKKFKLTVTFTMKSGKEIIVRCNHLTINKDGNELTGYSIDDAEIGSAFYIRIEDVSAIQYVRN